MTTWFLKVYDEPVDGQRYRFEPDFHFTDVAFEEAKAWCLDTFGPTGAIERTARWWPYLGRIWIRDEADALVFKMRWC